MLPYLTSCSKSYRKTTQYARNLNKGKNIMKTLAFVALSLLLVACSGQARQDYYQAVNVAGVAHSNTMVAKYQALADIATAVGASSSESSRTAAVMAIAMMPQTVVAPAYIEDETLSWAKALAGPLTGVAALLIQADLTNSTNKENNKTARAAISAQTQEQAALLDAVTDDTGAGVTTDFAIAGLVDIAGQGIDASTTTSGNAIDGMEIVSVASIVETGNIAGTAITQTGVIADTAITETGAIADTAITGVVNVSEAGFDAIEVITIDNSLTTLGIVTAP